MKKFLFIFLCFIISNSIIAQKKELEQAPINPEFEKYQKNVKQYDNWKTGYIPPPYKVNFDHFFTAQKDQGKDKSLPSSFDLRTENNVTTVKDQYPYGTCWAFAAIASVESRWKVLEDSEYDLSEKNLVTCNGYLLGVDDGGNQYMSAAYITRLDGLIAESDDPYNTLNSGSPCNDTLSPVAYAPEAHWLPDNIDEIKKAVMNYGAIATSMYWHSGSYNSNDYTYYYDGPADGSDNGGGHAVTIVGWDDNKSTAGGTGAWIIKNSWGISWGASGYFYLSYDDTQVLRSNSIYPLKRETEEIDSLYMYDKLGMVTSYGFQNDTAYALVKYEAQSTEIIRKIGSYINSYGTEVDIEIYDDFDASTHTLTNILDSIKGRKVLFPGYHTFDLTAGVSDDFYIKVKYITPDNNYPIPVERAISGYSSPNIKPSGYNWVSSEAQEWNNIGSDIPGKEYDLCIRAYTSRKNVQAAIRTDKDYICLDDTVTFTNKSIGNIDSLHWYFGEGASPMDTSGNGPMKVSYASEGNKDVSLAAFNSGLLVDSIHLKEHIKVENNLHIFFSNPSIRIPMEQETVIRVHGEAEEYAWEAQTGLIATEGPEATLLMTGSEEKSYTYKVTGTRGSCTDQDSITVTFSPKPENDDVCDAIGLSMGDNGPFSNSNATVQENEPLPELGDCNAPMQWCDEGGLHNSVWFKFTVSDTGKISFITKGMDTQIALYDANTCTDLLNDNYTLIAANDDYFGEDENYAAALMDVEGLTKDETYWLQMDGSAGGDEGEFTIEIKDPSTEIDEEFDLSKKINVYPNPSNGEFAISFNNLTAETVRLQLHSLDGKLVYEQNLTDIHDGKTVNLHLPNTDTGIYFLQLQTKEHTGTKKIIIQ